MAPPQEFKFGDRDKTASPHPGFGPSSSGLFGGFGQTTRAPPSGVFGGMPSTPLAQPQGQHQTSASIFGSAPTTGLFGSAPTRPSNFGSVASACPPSSQTKPSGQPPLFSGLFNPKPEPLASLSSADTLSSTKEDLAVGVLSDASGEQKPAKRVKLNFMDMQCITVGAQKVSQSFSVPKSLIKGRSKFLHSEQERLSSADGLGPIVLPRTDPEAFALYLQVLYRDEVVVQDDDEPVPQDRVWLLLTKMYDIANDMEDFRSLNIIMDEIVLRLRGLDLDTLAPIAKAIRYAFNHTCKGSELRRVFVDYAVHRNTNCQLFESVAELGSADFLVETSSAFVEWRVKAGPNPRTPDGGEFGSSAQKYHFNPHVERVDMAQNGDSNTLQFSERADNDVLLDLKHAQVERIGEIDENRSGRLQILKDKTSARVRMLFQAGQNVPVKYRVVRRRNVATVGTMVFASFWDHICQNPARLVRFCITLDTASHADQLAQLLTEAAK